MSGRLKRFAEAPTVPLRGRYVLPKLTRCQAKAKPDQGFRSAKDVDGLIRHLRQGSERHARHPGGTPSRRQHPDKRGCFKEQKQMPTISIRRLGVALLAAAVIFTTGTAFAADLSLTAPGTVGAGQQSITAPCTSMTATYTINYRSAGNAYYIDAVVLAGTGCTGTGLTVKVTLKDGATNPETIVTGVAATALNTGGANTGPYSVDVSGKDVAASALAGVVVLITA
jgi:hypothetical protein